MRYKLVAHVLLLAVATTLLPVPSLGQAATLTNDSIIQMASWNISDSEIIAAIGRSSRTNFDFSPSKLSLLRANHISAAVQQAMFDKAVASSGAPVRAANSPAPTPAAHAPITPSPVAAAPAPSGPIPPFPAGVEPPAGCETFPAISFDHSVKVNKDPIPMKPSSLDLSKMVQLNATGSGGEIYTKSSVYVAYVNRLRYVISLGGVVSVISAPTVPFGQMFTTTPLGPAQAGGKGQGQQPAIQAHNANALVAPSDNDQAKFDKFTKCYEHMRSTLTNFQTVLSPEEFLLNTTKVNITAATANLQPLAATANEAKAAADLTIFPDLESPPFPLTDLGKLKSLVSNFETQYANVATWANAPGNRDNQAKYQEVNAGAGQISDRLDLYLATQPATNSSAPSGNSGDGNGAGNANANKGDANANTSTSSSSTEASDYEAARVFVDNWRQIFRTVAGANDAYFVVTFKPACGGFFGDGTSTQMQMSIADSLNPPAAGSKVTPINLDKVVCQPTISLSNGLGLSFIPSQTPAFVPSVKKDAQGNPVLDSSGNPTIVQSLGYSSQSRVSAGYALQANASLWQFHDWNAEVHWSVGAMLTASTSGTTTDIITGPSFSFRRRTFFISPMYDLGLRTQYVPAFQVGMPQGNLTSPPTQQVWKSGFALTITFPFSSGTKNTDSSSGGATATTTPPAATTATAQTKKQ